jgi:hypothetical protein
MRSNEKSKGGRFLEMRATPEIDFECVILKKGQRVPKGYGNVRRLTADAFPAGWPPDKAYVCRCGCGKTGRIGDRVAYRNIRKTGRLFLTLPTPKKR